MIHRIGTSVLILTTLPHLFAAWLSPDVTYAGVWFVSTIASILWHGSGTSVTSPLGLLDHGLAASWFLADCIYGFRMPQFYRILCLNGLIALLDGAAAQIASMGYTSYIVSHSLWHIVSAVKATHSAFVLSTLQEG